MHSKMLNTRSALLGTAMAVAFPAAHAQIDDSIRGAPDEDNHFIATPEGWEHPMTPWGEPDIQAQLDMMQAAGVPLERCANSYRFDAPPCDMDKAWLTEEEYNERMEAYRNREDRHARAVEEGDIGTALRSAGDTRMPQRQTNLIVDPADGLLPALTPEGKRRSLEYGSDWALPGEDLTFDGPEDFDSWDRCVTRGMPSMMMPYRYNGGFRITQAPGYVVFDIEMIHEARIIPTDGGEPPDEAVKQWLGVSRGHWDGTTLVVETTNYPDGRRINNPMINLAVVGSPPGNRFAHSEQMKTTERITRLNEDWWLYEITTEDPVVLTEPFTVRYPMRDDPDYFTPEYACHEGNTIVRNYTETSRYERANPRPEPPQEPVEVAPSVASLLDGRWVGEPRIVTLDYEIDLEFTRNADGTVSGKLIGTTVGEIDKPLSDFMIEDGVIRFTFPNVSQSWTFAGQITDEGTIDGFVMSIQGGAPVTFVKSSD